MSLLFESIKIFQHTIYNLPYHEARVNRARKTLWGITRPADWYTQLAVPHQLDDGLYKCRVTYGPDIKNITFTPYSPSPLHSLAVVHDDAITYPFKSENREVIVSLWEKKGDCDDILIVREGLLTDSSYCNIACWDGNKWFTPASPLLEGTQRAKLIDEGVLAVTDIHLKDLTLFHNVRLFNAMMTFDDAPTLPVSQIHINR